MLPTLEPDHPPEHIDNLEWTYSSILLDVRRRIARVAHVRAEFPGPGSYPVRVEITHPDAVESVALDRKVIVG